MYWYCTVYLQSIRTTLINLYSATALFNVQAGVTQWQSGCWYAQFLIITLASRLNVPFEAHLLSRFRNICHFEQPFNYFSDLPRLASKPNVVIRNWAYQQPLCHWATPTCTLISCCCSVYTRTVLYTVYSYVVLIDCNHAFIKNRSLLAIKLK